MRRAEEEEEEFVMGTNRLKSNKSALYKRKNDNLGQFFRSRRVRRLMDRHESYLLKWLVFVETNY
jgi:hypothetical protein